MSGLPPPVVGVTSYAEPARWSVWDRPAAVLPASYLERIHASGGVALMLPPAPAEAAAAVVARLDALVLAGGADVEPRRYGQLPHRATVTRPDRDEWELALLAAALDRALPILAICRGMQLLNVARGGTLHQHLPEAGADPSHQPAAGRFGTTVPRLEPSSRLATLVTPTAPGAGVACHHHQAVERLGAGLRAVAWAPDGTVEAVEDPLLPSLVAVQWHPEEDPADPLFPALVAAARSAPAPQKEASCATT